MSPFVTVHLPPTVRSLFHRRAGKGVRAKLSEGVFAILGNSYAGAPERMTTKISLNIVTNMNVFIFSKFLGVWVQKFDVRQTSCNCTVRSAIAVLIKKPPGVLPYPT